ncbi:MAG: single-strand DNA-binding protein, partial [Arcobacteraceae bacterium]
VHKGSKVMLEGRLVFQQWKAQDGTNRNRHALSVTEFKFLDGNPSSQTTTEPNTTQQNNNATQSEQDKTSQDEEY